MNQDNQFRNGDVSKTSLMEKIRTYKFKKEYVPTILLVFYIIKKLRV